MLIEIENMKLRLLYGEDCKEKEIPCSIEYLTQTGSATVFAAAERESFGCGDGEKIQFLETEPNQWRCALSGREVQTEDFSWNDMKAVFEKNDIFIQRYKEDSEQIQEMMKTEKKKL